LQCKSIGIIVFGDVLADSLSNSIETNYAVICCKQVLTKPKNLLFPRTKPHVAIFKISAYANGNRQFCSRSRKSQNWRLSSNISTQAMQQLLKRL
jgi:hypothetical protein